MISFDIRIKQIMEDCVAGGVDSVFDSSGQIQAGQYGNQFPAQNDLAYAPGDARNIFGQINKKQSKKKSKKIKIQRRRLFESNKDLKVGDTVLLLKITRLDKNTNSTWGNIAIGKICNVYATSNEETRHSIGYVTDPGRILIEYMSNVINVSENDVVKITTNNKDDAENISKILDI